MSEDELFQHALQRIELLKSYGTGALEIKSGYGLTVDAELKMLRVVKRLKKEAGIAIKATFLGAHAFPLEYKEDHRGYIDMIINEMIPKIQEEGLAEYIDVFCERNYFSVDEMAEILEAGAKAGLIPKVHVDQFSALGGIRKAVEINALSVDHLEELEEDDIDALKGSNTVATILPSCSHFLNIPYGDAKRLMENNVAVALASDFNPGSTPSGNLSFVWSLACVKMRMTPEEALNALTVNGAFAMGLSDSHGSIKLGKKTPVILTKKIPNLAYIPYSFGDQLIEQIIGG